VDGRTLQCCICMGLPFDPIRLPCRCRTIMCGGCFKQFISGYSNCLVCRERIVQRLRRLIPAGKDHLALVDPDLAATVR